LSAEAESEAQEEGAKWVGRLLEIVGLEVMAEGVRAGKPSESWRERVTDCWSCNTEAIRVHDWL